MGVCEMVNPEVKQKIIDLHLKGWTKKEIGKKLDKDRNTVAKVVNRYKSDNIEDYITDSIQVLIDALNDTSNSQLAIKMLNSNGLFIKGQINHFSQIAVEDYKRRELNQLSEWKVSLINEINSSKKELADLKGKKAKEVLEIEAIAKQKGLILNITKLREVITRLVNKIVDLNSKKIEIENKIQYLEEHKFDNETYTEGFIDGGIYLIRGVQKNPEKNIINLLLARAELEFIDKMAKTLK